jgi:hypothetical protein
MSGNMEKIWIWKSFELIRKDNEEDNTKDYPYDLTDWINAIRNYINYISMFEPKIKDCDFRYYLKPANDTDNELKGIISFTCYLPNLLLPTDRLVQLINDLAFEKDDLTLVFVAEGISDDG